MSESGEKSSEQEQELRRRNIVAGDDFEKNEESSLIENIQDSGRKQSKDNNETMDSDHVRKNIYLIAKLIKLIKLGAKSSLFKGKLKFDFFSKIGLTCYFLLIGWHVSSTYATYILNIFHSS